MRSVRSCDRSVSGHAIPGIVAGDLAIPAPRFFGPEAAMVGVPPIGRDAVRGLADEGSAVPRARRFRDEASGR